MPHGTRGDFAEFSGAGWVDARGNWTRSPWAAGALLHFEQPEKFAIDLRAFRTAA